MPCYELWSSDSLKFWEFDLAGATVIARHGERGTKGQSTTKRFPSPDSARRAYDKLIAEKLAVSYWPPEGRNAPGDGVKARALEIRRLEDAAGKSRRIRIKFALGVEDGVVTVILDVRKPSMRGSPVPVRVDTSDSRSGKASLFWRGLGLGDQVDQIRRRYPDATVLLGKLVVKSWGSPLKPRELASLMTRVVTELFANVE